MSMDESLGSQPEHKASAFPPDKKEQLKPVLFIAIPIVLILLGTALYFSLSGKKESSTYTVTELSPLEKEFESLVKKTGEADLDLGKLKSVDWDNVVFWAPHTDICNYNINGYSDAEGNCRVTNDDSECYLLFLKDNALVGKVSIDTKKTDLTTVKWKPRVAKASAVLVYESHGEYPEMELKENMKTGAKEFPNASEPIPEEE